ncbi:hypothetical protein GCM10010156_08090 [Planobispora rosea]|uniref:DUF3159 domain-containing protein n=2 Tax=Planobispora rosea TaxID=35762 RepID=A0A8J3RYK4_PLARO|nr:hypothetical protein GCM10010156_08090 [Planobispora rosea]GIH82975.1 hypothetical protein Pro02_13830 [Planobispora rosea]
MGPEPASWKTMNEKTTISEQAAAHDTVEAAIRSQLAKAFGGIRGVIEAAVPTAAFTVMWIVTAQLQLSLIVSASAAVLLLVVRLVQRSTPQYVLNSLIGIGIGWFFATRTGEAKDVYLPGILYNAGYSVVMLISVVTRWPVVGFLIGSVTGDPTAWRDDPAVVRLCSKLTWLLMIPCVVRVAVQAPVYLIGGNDAVAELGILKIVMGWPLQIAALGAMIWLLTRGRTPVQPAS